MQIDEPTYVYIYFVGEKFQTLQEQKEKMEFWNRNINLTVTWLMCQSTELELDLEITAIYLHEYHVGYGAKYFARVILKRPSHYAHSIKREQELS